MKAGDGCPLTRRLRPAELAASCLFSDVLTFACACVLARIYSQRHETTKRLL